MKIKTLGSALVLMSTLGLILTGCGGGGSSSSSKAAVANTGVFADAPVKGLTYKTATLSGTTNDKGEFKYITGEKVKFTLGKNLVLGEVAAEKLITPYTLGKNTIKDIEISNTTKNIAMLLQSLDGNRANDKMLDLSKLKEFTFGKKVKIGANTDDIKKELTKLFGQDSFKAHRDPTATTIVDEVSALSTMNAYLYDHLAPESSNKFAAKWLEGRTLYIVSYSSHEKAWEKNKLVFGKPNVAHNLTIHEKDEEEKATWYIENDGGHGFLEILEMHGEEPNYTNYKIDSAKDGKIIATATSARYSILCILDSPET